MRPERPAPFYASRMMLEDAAMSGFHMEYERGIWQAITLFSGRIHIHDDCHNCC
jgi:hypothetical protein